MRQLTICILLCWMGLLFSASSWAFDSEQLLQPDEAFEYHVEGKNPERLLLTWDIADGYYLYRQKFKFVSMSPGIKTGEPLFPAGQTKQDKYFGTVEIYRDRLEVELPIERQSEKPATLLLEATFQGCSDAGVCYLPIQKVFSLALPETGATGSSF